MGIFDDLIPAKEASPVADLVPAKASPFSDLIPAAVARGQPATTIAPTVPKRDAAMEALQMGDPSILIEQERVKAIDAQLGKNPSVMQIATTTPYPIPYVSQQEGVLPQIGAAVANTAIGAVNFMASPLGGATAVLPVAPTIAKVAAGGLFGADMAYHGTEKLIEAPTLQGKVEGGLGLTMGALVGSHLATELAPEKVTLEQKAANLEKADQFIAKRKADEHATELANSGAPATSTEATGEKSSPPNAQPSTTQKSESGSALGGVAPSGESIGSEGPGAAASSEFPAQQTTGLKREVVDTERLARGAEPIPTVERQREETVVQDAENKVDADATVAPKIVAKIVDGGEKAITEHDAAVLLVERNRLMNERRSHEQTLADGNSAPSERVAAKTGLEAIETQLDRLDRAQRAAGSTWGRLGHMYQRLIREDFTLEAMERKQRAAKGAPLTEDDRATIKAQSEKITELQKAFDEAKDSETQAVQQAELTRVHEATIKELKGELESRPKFGKDVIDIARGVVSRWRAEADAVSNDIFDLLKSEGGGVGGVGGKGGKNIADANSIKASLVTKLALEMRATIGELGLKGAELNAKLIDKFGDAVKPYLADAWNKARQMIDAEKIPTKAREAVKRGIKTDKTPADIKARAKAEVIAGDELSHKTVADLWRAHVNEHLSKGEDVSGTVGSQLIKGEVLSDLKEIRPDLTERDVSRALSEYGKAKFPSKEADRVALSEHRNIERLQESITRLKEGRDTLKTGLQRDKASQDIRAKQAELNELLKKRIGPPSPEKLASMDEARQTALKNRISDIDKELRTGEIRPKSEPAPPSDKTESLMAERDAMREKLNEIRRESNPPKSDAEKQIEQLSKTKERLEKVLSGEVDPSKPKDFNPLSQTAEDIKTEILALHELTRQIKKDNRVPTNPEKAQIKALEAAIKRYEERTASADFSTAGKRTGPYSKAIEDLRSIRDARKAVYEAAKKASNPILTPEERYNVTRQKAIAKQLAELKDRVARNNYTKPAKKLPPDKTAETVRAEVDLAKAKRVFNEGLMRIEQAQRTKFQKTTDWIAGFTRANVLGHVSVLEHLAGAAVENLVTRPIGSAVAQLFRFNRTLDAIRKKAVYEGGWGGEMKGAAATLKSLGAAWQKIKTGKSDLDWLHETGKVYPEGVMEWVGGVHAAIKEPVRQGIYARAMELGIKAAEEKGLSPSTDEVLMKAISKDAYDVANMDIFMGDNLLTKALHHTVTGYLRNEKKNPGLSKLTANVLDILFPVVNAPTNIAIRKFRLVIGFPEAATRVIQAAKRGELANEAATLTPRDAELITRAFKYGLVGAAAGVYAWTHPQYFGGIQTLGQQAPRDKETGLHTGDIALPDGMRISHHLAHGPMGGHMNMIADARRLYDKQLANGGDQWTAKGEAAFFMMFSAFKDLPMMSTVGRLTSPYKGAGQKAGEMMKNMFIFGAAQDVAKAQDKDQSGNPIERRGDTFGDQIKSGIPGLRKTIPEKEVKSSHPIRHRR